MGGTPANAEKARPVRFDRICVKWGEKKFGGLTEDSRFVL